MTNIGSSEHTNSKGNDLSLHQDNSAQQVMHSSVNTLIECLLDVSENRLELYIANTKESFVTKTSARVLDAKRATTAFLNKAIEKLS